jgi:hypothetical protein
MLNEKGWGGGGELIKKSKKYVSKNIGCNILVVGFKYFLIN